jgi:hypothetical protein
VALFEQWLSEMFEQNPTVASGLGLSEHDSELGDFTNEAFAQRARSARDWAARLEQLGWALDVGGGRAGTASGAAARASGPQSDVAQDADRVDATLLRAHLAGTEVMDSWQYWRRDPDVYLGPCLWGVSNLFLHRLRPEPELVEAAICRLHQVPAVLANASRQLDPALASPIVLERGVVGARGGARFFASVLPAEVADPALRAAIAGPADAASEALNLFAEQLEQIASRAHGSWALGEERYTALLRDRELLDMSAGQLSAVGSQAWDQLDKELDGLARRVDKDARDWRAVKATLSADHPTSPDELLGAYTTACDRAREFLVERQLVTLPEGEQCVVEASPEFLRGVMAVASYQEPPAFAEGRRGHFFVPFPPRGAGSDEVEELLRDNSWSAVPTVAVHEAYPGHHWQLTWSQQVRRPLRKVITTPYFVEGWALYAEAMMRREGFFRGPEEELAHVEARIFRAARVVVDTALHAGDMGFDEAVSYMTEHSSLTASVARAEVRRYCAWPTHAASYLVGALELERLRESWLAEGLGDLQGFHDRVAASPGMPLPLAGWELFNAGVSTPSGPGQPATE